MSRAGRLIILTGINGVGKTEQATRLEKRAKEEGAQLQNIHVLKSNPAVTAMRSVVLAPETHPTSQWSEVLAFYSMHAETAEQVVVPKLEAGENILLDRGPDSTHVYNYISQGLDKTHPELGEIYERLMAVLQPDLVILLDAPSEVTLQRAAQQGETDYLQDHEKAVHEQRRQGFLSLAKTSGWQIVDATKSIDEVADAVWSLVSSTLNA